MLKEYQQVVQKCPVLMSEMTIWMHFCIDLKSMQTDRDGKGVNGQYIYQQLFTSVLKSGI